MPDLTPLASWPRGNDPAKDRSETAIVIYVGADDCAPCRKFYEEQWPAIRNSERLTGIDFREIRSPTFRDVLGDEHWEADLWPYRSALPPDAGVPLWLIVRKGAVVKTAWGVNQWNDQIMPLLRRIAAR